MFRVAVPQQPEFTHRRQCGETVAETLHSAAFVIDGDQQRWLSQRVDIVRESRQLPGRFVVTREQDYAADQRMREALAITGREIGAGDVEHYRAERNVAGDAHFSSTTKAQARLFSSLIVRWCPVMPALATKCVRLG